MEGDGRCASFTLGGWAVLSEVGPDCLHSRVCHTGPATGSLVTPQRELQVQASCGQRRRPWLLGDSPEPGGGRSRTDQLVREAPPITQSQVNRIIPTRARGMRRNFAGNAGFPRATRASGVHLRGGRKQCGVTAKPVDRLSIGEAGPAVDEVVRQAAKSPASSPAPRQGRLN